MNKLFEQCKKIQRKTLGEMKRKMDLLDRGIADLEQDIERPYTPST